MRISRFCLLLALAVLGSPTLHLRALDPSLFNDGFAPLTPELTQFFTDLEAIPAGSTGTDAQHATLLADLIALPPGPAAPDAATLDQLATDFGSVAVAGLVDDDLEYQLAMDFDVDPDDPDSWLAYVQNDVQFALNPPAPIDPNDPGLPIETAIPTVARAPVPGVVITHEFILLKSVYDTVASQSPIVYSASVRLDNRTPTGGTASPTLTVSVSGLPADETYTLSIVRQSDGAKVEIGQFVPQTFIPEPEGGATLTFAYRARTYLNTYIRVSYGVGTGQPLPQGFDPDDVKKVLVTNAEGRTRFIRKLSAHGATTHTRLARLHLSASSSGGAVGSTTTVCHLDRYGSVYNHLRLKARRLPANATLTLMVDGVAVDQYATTADGRLVIAQRSTAVGTVHPYDLQNVNPALAKIDLSNAQSVSLVDAAGTIVLSGNL